MTAESAPANITAMVRVYLALSGSNLLVLLAALVLGFLARDERTRNMHVALAVFAAVVTCLVHVISLMYMVVIGKLTRQAVELGKLDREPRWELDRLKTGVSIGLAAGLLSVLAAVGTGATTLRSPQWHGWHQGAAWLAILTNGAVFMSTLNRIFRAARISDETFEKYNQAKAMRIPD